MRLAFVLAITACAPSTDSSDVVGPFHGALHRYTVDSITVPMNNADARMLGDDLDGDGAIDNLLGQAFSSLVSVGDATSHTSDMIASHVFASSLEIQTDDVIDAPKVGVQYFGAPGDAAVDAGGTLVGGVFVSNRTRTTSVPGAATIALPAFVDADPLRLELEALEIDLTPDPTGYVAVLRGGVDVTATRDAAWIGVQQMIASKPSDYLELISLLDRDNNGLITRDEFDAFSSPVFTSDVTLFGHHLMSFGFSVHLVPCDAGSCTTAAPTDTCSDRVLDGDETAVDCGGSCKPCPTAAACKVASDCQSNACDADDGCRAPTCKDGVQDGLERGVDCGGGCNACQ